MATKIELSKVVRPCVRNIKPYVAGKSPKSSGSRRVKLASNENRLGSSGLALEAVSRALKNGLYEYSDSHQNFLKEATLAFWKKHGVNLLPEQLVFGDGSGEVLSLIFNTLVNENESVIFPEKSFILYALQAGIRNARVIESARNGFVIDTNSLVRDAIRYNAKLVILANPDNPTSSFIHRDKIREMMEKMPAATMVLLDEAYIHFAGLENSALGFIEDFPNLIIIHTFSKAYGLAALRVGYGVMHGEIAAEIEKIRLPFNLGVLQQEGAAAALSDDVFLNHTLNHNKQASLWLQKQLSSLGYSVAVEPFANFLFVDLGENSQRVYSGLEASGITIRNLESFGFGARFARITIGSDTDNEYLIETLKKYNKR